MLKGVKMVDKKAIKWNDTPIEIDWDETGIEVNWRKLLDQSHNQLGMDGKGLESRFLDSQFLDSLQELPRDLAYLAVAYKFSEIYSRDPSTQNGAILVSPEGEVLVGDVNRLVDGIRETDEIWNSSEKYDLVVHAEEGVLLSAGKLGIPTEGTTMYCPWYACFERCARPMLRSGIIEVKGHKRPMEHYISKSPEKAAGWLASIDNAFALFDRVNDGDRDRRIKYGFVDASVDINNGTQIRVGGELLTT